MATTFVYGVIFMAIYLHRRSFWLVVFLHCCTNVVYFYNRSRFELFPDMPVVG